MQAFSYYKIYTLNSGHWTLDSGHNEQQLKSLHLIKDMSNEDYIHNYVRL